jgi:hypothetical protein
VRLRNALACLTPLAVCLLSPVGPAAAAPAAAAADDGDARYQLVHGCYSLRSRALGKFVAKTSDGGYTASAGQLAEAEPFRMQATALGKYLLYGRDGDFMAIGEGEVGGVPGLSTGERIESAPAPSEAADWTVDVADGGTFTIAMPDTGKAVATSGDNGQLRPVMEAGGAALFSFEPAQGCAVFPEAETSTTGEPSKGAAPFSEVRGFVDAHIHMMAFEFLGGRAHCGRPWHPYGVTVALVDCPDHEPGGAGAALESVLSYGTPVHPHDTVGWPTFKDWPAAKSLTHEQTYYKWLERAYRGGLRVYVNLLVDNAVLCEVYPYKKNNCNEMDTVRLEAKRMFELQDYIDAQSGGPGKGWFRIVKDPFEARRVANSGKLAVVMGIEVSKLFDCGIYNDQPECTAEQIDQRLNEVYDLGVRDMELVNKFDNALAGVAGDSGNTGVVVNNGNFIETGKYWEMQTCDPQSPPGAEDRPQTSAPGTERDALVGGVLGQFAPLGTLPVYPPPPHCNARGLSDLGEHLIRQMMAKKMIVDPDHLSVNARNHVLSILESKRYSGVVSSHSWSTPDSYPRIYKLGGVITPYAGDSTSFVKAWQETKPMRDKRFFFGFGYGADMNGFGAQGDPRGADVPNPVTYPFKSFDGKVTIDRERSGERTWDINVDGVAHYGLYPDWIEDLRKLAGDQIVKDMARGSEAYLQMWERAEGIKRRCFDSRVGLDRFGLGRARLGESNAGLLRRAGQPSTRGKRVWRYCVKKRRAKPRGRMAVVLSAGRADVSFIATNAPRHKGWRIGRGTPASRIPARAQSLGGGLRVLAAGGGRQWVYRVRGGRVRYIAVATGAASRSRAAIVRNFRLAGFR